MFIGHAGADGVGSGWEVKLSSVGSEVKMGQIEGDWDTLE
jgi:hypothetical protein